jgi:predicted NAD/FAD-dependent oxidoreductase
VHSRNDWAEAHIDDDMKASEAFLLMQLAAVAGIDASKADFISTHRWRYALVKEPQKAKPYIDEALRIASTGDWCTASRVEDVWLNAQSLAQALRSAVR